MKLYSRLDAPKERTKVLDLHKLHRMQDKKERRYNERKVKRHGKKN